MSFRKLLATAMVALSVLFMVQPAEAALGGVPTITFKLKDASGKSLGQATVAAQDALGSALATFFQSVADAIREMMAVGGNPTRQVWISSKVMLELTGVGLIGTGGAGVSSP